VGTLQKKRSFRKGGKGGLKKPSPPPPPRTTDRTDNHPLPKTRGTSAKWIQRAVRRTHIIAFRSDRHVTSLHRKHTALSFNRCAVTGIWFVRYIRRVDYKRHSRSEAPVEGTAVCRNTQLDCSRCAGNSCSSRIKQHSKYSFRLRSTKKIIRGPLR